VTESLRVSGFGNAMLSDVVCTVPSLEFKTSEKSDYVRELEAEKAHFEGHRRVVDHHADLLLSYAKGLTGEHVKPDDMAGFLEKFLAIGTKNVENIQEIEKRAADIDEKLKKEREEPTEKVNDSSKRKAKVKLVINAEDDHEAEISLTYRESNNPQPLIQLNSKKLVVNNVRWESAFDLRATTDPDGRVAPKVAVHYRASIIQSTGEDWEGVILTLSTAHPTTNTSIPQLKNIKIKPSAGFLPSVKGGFKPSLFGGNYSQQQQQVPVIPQATGGGFGAMQSQMQSAANAAANTAAKWSLSLRSD
jgi:hypothetical protein